MKLQEGNQADGLLNRTIKKYGKKRENVLAILHEIQNNTEGHYLKEEQLRSLAEKMELPYSDLHGVVTFYSMFSTRPRGKYIIRVCESGPCSLLGANTIFEVIQEELNIDLYETTEDKLFTLEPTSCLGICGVAPAMMINEETYGNLTPKRIRDVLALYNQEQGVEI